MEPEALYDLACLKEYTKQSAFLYILGILFEPVRRLLLALFICEEQNCMTVNSHCVTIWRVVNQPTNNCTFAGLKSLLTGSLSLLIKLPVHRTLQHNE
jgi:hypothetical protein